MLLKNKKMKIGYPDTKNKLGGSSPLYSTDEKKKKQQNVLPDPKLTKPKVARQMKRSGEITKEEFKTYKEQYKAHGTKKNPAITSGDTGSMHVKGDGGPNENFTVAVPRRKWKKKIKKEKRGSKSAKAYDKKIRASAPRHTEYRKIPKSERTEKELKYKIDEREVKVNDTKKAARKRYKKWKKENK